MKKIVSNVLLATFILGVFVAVDLINPSAAEASYNHEKVSTDKQVYTKGETIYVTGTVDPDFYESNMMRIDFRKGWFELVDETFVTIDSTGRFHAEFQTDASFESGDDYQISVFHAVDGRQWDMSEWFTIK
ncbi:hypothetical protein [Halalkalibacter sp. APA_J-10(15)]|uniref:hypothetical protein n=1 Tax=Halalkalibacter sp. APA_J-10(15) TaxID=2933805 RepID=UPI001FF4C77B|nr:hypothetical protein [Halalkalibacter sp. APA_J-10(15)]MCK0470271.1 hypothetical protein [Halalkalibacter sp. APA_J-10(15)]